MSQLINAISNQDVAGLDKFRLRESFGKMKEMRAQFVKTNKNNRNESSLSEFLSSPFPPAMPKPMPMRNISLPLATRENALFTLKKKEFLLESKLEASSEKISSLQGTVSFLNMCIGKKNK